MAKELYITTIHPILTKDKIIHIIYDKETVKLLYSETPYIANSEVLYETSFSKFKPKFATIFLVFSYVSLTLFSVIYIHN